MSTLVHTTHTPKVYDFTEIPGFADKYARLHGIKHVVQDLDMDEVAARPEPMSVQEWEKLFLFHMREGNPQDVVLVPRRPGGYWCADMIYKHTPMTVVFLTEEICREVIGD